MKKCEGYDVSIMLIDQADREIEARQRMRNPDAAKEPPARRPPQPTPPLSNTVIRELHRHHMRGVSIRQLGRQHWQRLGASSDRSLALAIRSAFHRKGLKVRAQRDAVVLARTKRPKVCGRAFERSGHHLTCDLPTGHPGFHHYRAEVPA
jgi:hypothetical protein